MNSIDHNTTGSWSTAVLTAFEPINLKEMESVKLMDRVETKFVFHVKTLDLLWYDLKDHYYIMEHQGVRSSRYETVYFDTDDFLTYRMHHNGKANRFKLRIRRYLDTSTAFYEFKLKTNKKRTRKQRIECPWDESEMQIFRLSRHLDIPQLDEIENLSPSIKVNYRRVTLVGKRFNERITLDTDLETTAGTFSIASGEFCIAEVKQAGRADSEFVKLMHRMQISPLRISKYCLGMMLHHPWIRKNNFKPRLIRLEKIKGTVPELITD